MFKKIRFNITYKPILLLNRLIKIGKDKLEKTAPIKVMYKINCLNCEAIYMQAKQKGN